MSLLIENFFKSELNVDLLSDSLKNCLVFFKKSIMAIELNLQSDKVMIVSRNKTYKSRNASSRK